jgi:predicted transposase YdaD
LKTDHWFYGLFQSAPDLIALLVPQGSSALPSLGPDAPGDALYRFDAPELKAANHRLDGAFWPKSGEAGTPEHPVVLLEVQMHAKPGFKHRLGAQSFRFLQLHPQVLHLAVVVVVPHRRLKLGPALLPQQLQTFVDGVIWLSLEELGQQADLDPWLTLLTLPVQPEAQLKRSTQQILVHHPELLSAVLTMLLERLPTLTTEELMVFAGIPTDQLLHTVGSSRCSPCSGRAPRSPIRGMASGPSPRQWVQWRSSGSQASGSRGISSGGWGKQLGHLGVEH